MSGSCHSLQGMGSLPRVCSVLGTVQRVGRDFSSEMPVQAWSRFKKDLGKSAEKERIGEKAFSLCPLGLGGGLGELDSEEGKGRGYKHLSGQVTPPTARGRTSPPTEQVCLSALTEFSNSIKQAELSPLRMRGSS